MSVTVKKLYKDGIILYKMKLLAGKKGLDNFVKWVHIIEDENAREFLRGSELIFTAGIQNNQDYKLLNFARNLHESGASALVVNIGPYIKEIPREVAEYCDEIGMPLFSIPWETRIVDMTKDFCNRIIHNEHIEDTIATSLKNIIFRVGDFDAQVSQLERYGYQKDSKFCFICSSIRNGDGGVPDSVISGLKIIAEKNAKSIHELYISFTYQENRMLVLTDYEDNEIENYVSTLIRIAEAEFPSYELNMGVSPNQTGLSSLNSNFEKAISAMEMARRRGEKAVFFDKLGIYKLLCAMDDKTLLRNYCDNIIGRLEQYDSENNTELTITLKTYLEKNGSLQEVSKKLFLHRNTVTNRLKKIEEITGYDPLELDGKLEFMICFRIKDIL